MVCVKGTLAYFAMRYADQIARRTVIPGYSASITSVPSDRLPKTIRVEREKGNSQADTEILV